MPVFLEYANLSIKCRNMRTTFFLEKYHCNFVLMIKKFPFLDLKTETGQKCSSYQMCCFRKKKKGREENALNKTLYSEWGIIPSIVLTQSIKAYQTVSREKKRKKSLTTHSTLNSLQSSLIHDYYTWQSFNLIINIDLSTITEAWEWWNLYHKPRNH